jgi:hypothetical protein
MTTDDCGHVCCEFRNSAHVHAVEPDDCLLCADVRTTGELPSASLQDPITTQDANGGKRER